MTDAGWFLRVWLRGDRHITIEAGDVNRLDAEVATYVRNPDL